METLIVAPCTAIAIDMMKVMDGLDLKFYYIPYDEIEGSSQFFEFGFFICPYHNKKYIEESLKEYLLFRKKVKHPVFLAISDEKTKNDEMVSSRTMKKFLKFVPCRNGRFYLFSWQHGPSAMQVDLLQQLINSIETDY